MPRFILVPYCCSGRPLLESGKSIHDVLRRLAARRRGAVSLRFSPALIDQMSLRGLRCWYRRQLGEDPAEHDPLIDRETMVALARELSESHGWAGLAPPNTGTGYLVLECDADVDTLVPLLHEGMRADALTHLATPIGVTVRREQSAGHHAAAG